MKKPQLVSEVVTITYWTCGRREAGHRHTSEESAAKCIARQAKAPKHPRRSNAEIFAIAKRWADGERQIDIAADIGRSSTIVGNMMDWPGEPALWRPQQSVCAALAGEYPRVVLVPFDAASYAAWLEGRADDEALRAAWAGLSLKT